MSDTSQGPGWWQASDGKWYPPEQAPGYQAPAGDPTAAVGTPASSAASGTSIGDAFNYGWAKFQANVGPILIAALIGFVILIVLVIVWFIVNAVAFAATTSCHTDAATGFQVCHTSGGGFFTLLISYAIFGLLYILGLALFQMALIRASLFIVNGEVPLELGRMFSTDQIGPYILASIVFAIGAGIGYFLCFIPGLIFVFFAQWYGYFLIGKQMAPVDSIKASFTFVNSNIGTLVGFYIACLVAYFIGALLCGIGLLVAVPVVIIAQGFMWRRLQGEPVAA